MSSSILSKGVKPPRGPRCIQRRRGAGESQSRSSSSIHLARNLSLSRHRRRNGGGKGAAFDGGRVEDGRTASECVRAVYWWFWTGVERCCRPRCMSCRVCQTAILCIYMYIICLLLPSPMPPPPHIPTVLRWCNIIIYAVVCISTCINNNIWRTLRFLFGITTAVYFSDAYII